MRRVLLYEPNKAGHHPVILRYLAEGLLQFGWDPVVLSDPSWSTFRGPNLPAIEEEARRKQCELIHLLNIGGNVRNWLLPRFPKAHPRLPVVGSYYLFNNLLGWKGLAWLAAIHFGYIDRILVSDPFLSRRYFLPGLRDRIGYVPDPWSRSEFPPLEQRHARELLGLPLHKKLVLVFGEISQRKGVSRILDALRQVKNDSLHLIFAGSVQEDASQDLARAKADPALAWRLHLFDRHIPEEEVTAFFHAVDAVLSDYPKWFKVSSGAFTRTLAAGRIPLLPKHGVNFEFAQQHQIGLFYESESSTSLAAAMTLLANSDDLQPAPPWLATERESAFFCSAVAESYAAALRPAALAG